MLLAIDVGNTNIVLGVYDGERLRANWRLATDPEKMPDEYGALLVTLSGHAGLDVGLFTRAIISSTVPGLTAVLSAAVRAYCGSEPLIAGHRLLSSVRCLVDNPAEVGPDRLVNTYAAFHRYGGPAIVIDFGTATSFDVVSAEGDFVGGSIAPGIQISMEALVSHAARLPRFALMRPPAAIGKNTIACMQSGLVYGYVGLVEGIVARLQAELPARAIVLATGGLAEIIAAETSVISHVDPLLTLEGLRMLAEANAADAART